MDEQKKNQLGTLLKEHLRKRSLSLRELSERTHIDKATISRIMNGKRKANLNHLQRFSESLGVSFDELMTAAGYAMEKARESERQDIHSSVAEIEDVLQTSNVYDRSFTMEELQNKLNEYEQYSQTEEGKRTIMAEFESKVEKVAGIGPFLTRLHDMYSRFTSGRGTPRELLLMGGALLYFIVSVDVIPDYIFPIGYIDDAAAVHFVFNQLTHKS
ncbi:helix-turn-helix domain-containing protein [Bacillus haynesii]|uniref:helix-turn-helix domain-containing protein n=1 Tax=Bacillus haynesii TaxID=1925021 RepID=UPI00227DE423|nr:helix-turn-helix domain-containing protein [Bacillus haynesii]MCY7850370.1 helix-turn-helix domain-containing protein [Bacillus haynesii]MCY8539628.1 helix-turn-helix domain-containing protein [Bacillus haynesii]MEC0633346.1 helix-turn-helix domain-containing protein [Bacillus haynesii]